MVPAFDLPRQISGTIQSLIGFVLKRALQAALIVLRPASPWISNGGSSQLGGPVEGLRQLGSCQNQNDEAASEIQGSQFWRCRGSSQSCS